MNSIKTWSPAERVMRISYPLVEERVIDQFLDSERKVGEKFSFYYFVKDLTFGGPWRDKTILFASGGPGQIIRPTGRNFVDVEGYRVVYFHLRGSGFSQIPETNDYDAYLRTPFAVEDIEAIRQDLGIEQWCAIIGHSYGTVLAQQYAHRYPNHISKVILSAPLSCHKAVKETMHFKSLEMIYQSKYFRFLDNISEINHVSAREHIVKETQKISDGIESEYGSVQAFIDKYDEASKDRWDCSISFLRAMRRLRHTGWLPFDEDIAAGVDSNVSTQQQGAGWVVAKEILAKRIDLLEIFKDALEGETDPKQKNRLETLNVVIPWAEDHYRKPQTQTSARTFYVMTFYDGLDVRWRNNSVVLDPGSAIIAREGNQRNDSIRKVGILERENPKAWDPGDYAHYVDTLIVIGGADPVTEGGLADHFFDKGLRGNRVLIQFPGIGHAMALPGLSDENKHLRTVEIPFHDPKTNNRRSRPVVLDTREALFHTFLGKDFSSFKNAGIIGAIKDAFKELFESLDEYKPEPVTVRS